MLNKIIVCASAFLLLTGCASTKPKIIEAPVLVDRPELILPKVQPVNQASMEWVIITASNAEEKLEMLKSKDNVTYFALTPQGYQNLSMNVAELRRYIEQQNAVIAAYQAYYANLPKPPRPEKR
jgi:uncharacterized lipoprotein YajG